MPRNPVRKSGQAEFTRRVSELYQDQVQGIDWEQADRQGSTGTKTKGSPEPNAESSPDQIEGITGRPRKCRTRPGPKPEDHGETGREMQAREKSKSI